MKRVGGVGQVAKDDVKLLAHGRRPFVIRWTSSGFQRQALAGTVGSNTTCATPLDPIRSRSRAIGIASHGWELPRASIRPGRLVNATAAFSPDSSSRNSKPT